MAMLLLSLVSVIVLIIFTASSSLVVAEKSDPLIRVTDDNWKDVLEGEWMVEVMAPWCPSCQSLTPTWQSLADRSRDLDIKVGVVDVTENPGLGGRFLVKSLPTIYHVKDGEFRIYTGPREKNGLLSFVEDKKWQDIETVSSWRHPNSFQMGAVGIFFKFSMVVRNFYHLMSSEYGVPEWLCYIIFAVFTLIVGLLLAVIFVCCCDCLFPPKYVPAHQIAREDVEDDRDDESDVIEDISHAEGEGNEDGGDAGLRHRQVGGQGPSEGKEDEASSS